MESELASRDKKASTGRLTFFPRRVAGGALLTDQVRTECLLVEGCDDRTTVPYDSGKTTNKYHCSPVPTPEVVSRSSCTSSTSSRYVYHFGKSLIVGPLYSFRQRWCGVVPGELRRNRSRPSKRLCGVLPPPERVSSKPVVFGPGLASLDEAGMLACLRLRICCTAQENVRQRRPRAA